MKLVAKLFCIIPFEDIINPNRYFTFLLLHILNHISDNAARVISITLLVLKESGVSVAFIFFTLNVVYFFIYGLFNTAVSNSTYCQTITWTNEQ
jgi:hypothetical protein